MPQVPQIYCQSQQGAMGSSSMRCFAMYVFWLKVTALASLKVQWSEGWMYNESMQGAILSRVMMDWLQSSVSSLWRQCRDTAWSTLHHSNQKQVVYGTLPVGYRVVLAQAALGLTLGEHTQSSSAKQHATHGLEPSILKILVGSDTSAVIWVQARH